MPALRFDVFAAAFLPIILAPGVVLAQTPSPTGPQEPVAIELRTPPAPATPPDSVTAGIFPLSQVHRGLRGTAYTVFEGVRPAPIDVEILGVLHNALGPKQDMILARLGGKDAVYTGVVAGMSGSPVYIDGKLAGALAFRIGQFSKEPIAGITPIEQMMQVRDLPAGGSPPTGAGNGEMRPIETPLLFSGFNQQTIDAFKDRFTAQGLTPVVGLGGGATGQRQPEPIEPGSAVSALLVRGDMEVAATCTVTYVDKQQLLACGHPITQSGAISVPMTKAEVVATLPSPLNAFKIVNTTEEVGAFTEDRQTAIRGEFGRQAHTVPVSIQFHGPAPRTVRFDVVDSPDITPLLLLTSIYQALMQSNTYAAETTYHIRERIAIDGETDVDLTRYAAPAAGIPSALGATLQAGEPFVQLYASPARRGILRSVSLDVDALPGHQTIEIESAERQGGTVHAGDTLQLRATLHPWRGEPRTVQIPITLPATLPPGPVRLVVSDAATFDHMIEAPTRNLDMHETVAALNATHANDRIYVTMLTPNAQARVDGRTLTALPISMANVLDPLRANRALTLNGESAVAITSLPMDAVVTGNQVVAVQVE